MQATKTSSRSSCSGAASTSSEQGFVASLARPGGNVTGLISSDQGLLAKQFETAAAGCAAPRGVSAWLYNPDIPPHLLGLRDVETVAQRQGVQVQALATMRTPAEIDATFDALQRERVEAVHFFLQPFLDTGDARTRWQRIALQQRWPTALALPPQAQPASWWPMASGRGPAAPAAPLRGPHPEGHPARRDAGGAADALLPGAEPEDRQGAGTDAAAVPAAAGRRADRRRHGAVSSGPVRRRGAAPLVRLPARARAPAAPRRDSGEFLVTDFAFGAGGSAMVTGLVAALGQAGLPEDRRGAQPDHSPIAACCGRTR